MTAGAVLAVLLCSCLLLLLLLRFVQHLLKQLVA
jgi:hypothetical protein